MYILHFILCFPSKNNEEVLKSTSKVPNVGKCIESPLSRV